MINATIRTADARKPMDCITINTMLLQILDDTLGTACAQFLNLGLPTTGLKHRPVAVNLLRIVRDRIRFLIRN